MIFIKLISKLLKTLGSNAAPRQVAWGFALGSIWGLTPLMSLHNALVLILILILKVNLSAALFSLALFTLLAVLLAPLFHLVGIALLVNLKALTPLWTHLYNAPVAPFTRFNNTVVLGSLAVALALLIPLFFLFKWAVVQYRDRWAKAVKKWKIVQVMQSSKLVKLVSKIKSMGV